MEKLVKVFMVICHKCDYSFLFRGLPDAIVCPACNTAGKRVL